MQRKKFKQIIFSIFDYSALLKTHNYHLINQLIKIYQLIINFMKNQYIFFYNFSLYSSFYKIYKFSNIPHIKYNKLEQFF